MNKFSLLWKTFHYLIHVNRNIFRIRRIHFKLLHSVTVTKRIIVILYFCNELYLYMETFSLPCSQKPTKKTYFESAYSFHTLTLCHCHCMNHFNIILCHELYIFMEIISLLFSQKPTKKDLF